MLLKIIQVLKKKGINKIVFQYLKTQKNKPCFEFLKNNLEKVKNNLFIYRKNTKFIPPKFVKIS